MTISGGSALPKDEIDRMVREAEQHAEEDRRRREEVETRNTAEQLVYQTERFLSDNADKLPESRGEVDTALADLKKVLEQGNDASIDEIKTKTDVLAKASQSLGAAMYAQSQGANAAADGAGAGAGSAGAGAGAEDDVVDAEIVDDEAAGKGQ